MAWIVAVTCDDSELIWLYDWASDDGNFIATAGDACRFDSEDDARDAVSYLEALGYTAFFTLA